MHRYRVVYSFYNITIDYEHNLFHYLKFNDFRIPLVFMLMGNPLKNFLSKNNIDLNADYLKISPFF